MQEMAPSENASGDVSPLKAALTLAGEGGRSTEDEANLVTMRRGRLMRVLEMPSDFAEQLFQAFTGVVPPRLNECGYYLAGVSAFLCVVG